MSNHMGQNYSGPNMGPMGAIGMVGGPSMMGHNQNKIGTPIMSMPIGVSQIGPGQMMGSPMVVPTMGTDIDPRKKLDQLIRDK